MEVATMPRPNKIRLNTSQKVTALTSEGALDRWQPAIQAAVEDDNTISVYDVIGEDFWTGEGVTVKRIDAALRKIGNRDVVVNINSPGGDVFEGIAIYNRLREHPAKVQVKVMGLAASAASIIAMAGDEVQIGEASFLMIHNAWVMAVGNQFDLREVADFLAPFDEALRDVYVQRTGTDASEVEAMMKAETWISGKKAVETGFADTLLSADETKQVENAANPQVNALRRAEANLCKEMPRSAARDLLNQIKGKQDAAPDPATQDAGDPELSTALAGLLDTIRA
jgi:ATP-dependent protease ClpP protease subunit